MQIIAKMPKWLYHPHMLDRMALFNCKTREIWIWIQRHIQRHFQSKERERSAPLNQCLSGGPIVHSAV